MAKWLGWSLLAVAIGLALSHLLVMRTLWLDEAMLALNCSSGGWLRLLKPLSSAQVAPIGYLFLSKAAFHLLPGYLGLRLVSFCAYLASIFFFWRGLQWGNWTSASGQTHSTPTPLLTAAYAATPIFLRYSNEVKQYMFDALAWTVAFAALMALLYGAVQLRRKDHTILLATMGPVLISLSNISVFVLAAWGATWAAHLIHIIRNPSPDRRILWLRSLFIFGTWGLFFAAYYTAFIYKHPAKNFMQNFWTNMDAFMPLSSSGTFPWLLQSFQGLAAFGFELIWPRWMVLAIALVMAWGTWSARSRLRSNWMPLFFILPLALHLLASALEMYPFQSRLAIWHLPGMMAMLGLALTHADQISFRSRPSTSLLTLLTLALLGSGFRQNSKQMGDFSAELQYLNAHPETTLIVHFSNGPSFRFHQQLHENLDALPFIILGGWKSEKLEEIPSIIKNLPADAHYLGLSGDGWEPYVVPDSAFRKSLRAFGLHLEEVVPSDKPKLFRIAKQP